MLKFKRVTLFCGHYGSGKTNIAVNYAFWIKEAGFDVRVADMDIVNPYFRTKDSEKELSEKGIDLISPKYANSNVDLPALPQELYGLFQQKDKYAVLDIGGDDRGAYALGRFAPLILEENNFDCLFVANFFRPLTRTAQEAYEVMKEIEAAGGVPFTSIVNNSNLGEDTLPENVESTQGEALRLAELSALPLVMTTAKGSIAAQVNCDNVMPLTLQKKYY